jgi:hypothetical protein
VAHGFGDFLGAAQALDFERTNLNVRTRIKPTGSMSLPLAQRSRSTIQINPKCAASDNLKIEMPATDKPMIERHIRPMITTKNGKRLVQKPDPVFAGNRTPNADLQ